MLECTTAHYVLHAYLFPIFVFRGSEVFFLEGHVDLTKM